MFSGVKNQMLAKLKVEKFISSEYVNFIVELEKLLRSDMSKEDILGHIMNIKDQIIRKYNLTDKDIINEK